ncbi:MAG: LysR family transcriptional regulator substrate-binding protein, partial [Coleofasciculaceae cyanobacterium SM2_3_26]|nr:LysR family transcriptional regulator substrate-binding protein [Coleofasciculaceae cyanobacterium SM2_3_26]
RVLAVSTNDPLASRETVQLSDLDGQPFIERLHCERYREIQKLFTSIRPRIAYRADQEEWVLSLVAAGLGLSIMPEWSNVPGVVFIPITDLPLKRTVGLVWRNGYESEAIAQFLACAGNHNVGESVTTPQRAIKIA